MATKYLINNVRGPGGQLVFAGTSYDDVTDAALIAALQAAGGQLVPTGAIVAAAAIVAQQIHLQGGDPNMMQGIMLAASAGGADAAAIAAAQADATAALANAATAEADAQTGIADAAIAKGIADAAVPLVSVQTGVAALGAGGSVAIGAANITAGSVIVPIRDVPDPVAANLGTLTISGATPGAPGSFNIDSSNAADTSSVRWLVIG